MQIYSFKIFRIKFVTGDGNFAVLYQKSLKSTIGFLAGYKVQSLESQG